MVDCVSSNRYRSFEPWQNPESKYDVCGEDNKTCCKRAFDTIGGYSLHSESFEIAHASTRIGSCFKRKTRGEDPVLYSTIQPPSLKKVAVNRRILPSGIACVSRSHGLRSTKASETSRLDTGCRYSGAGLSSQNFVYSDCQAEQVLGTLLEICLFESMAGGCAQMNDVNLLNQTFSTVEEQFWAAQEGGPVSVKGKLHSFLQFLWSSFLPCSYSMFSSILMASASCKDAVQRFMDGDAIDFEYKQEEDDKDKEALDRMSDEKNAKEDSTRTTKESKDEDKGQGGKENQEDEGKKTGERRDKKESEREREREDVLLVGCRVQDKASGCAGSVWEKMIQRREQGCDAAEQREERKGCVGIASARGEERK